MNKNKKCADCGIEKPANTDFFYKNGKGLDKRCKECKRKTYRKHYYKDVELTRKKAREQKRNRTDEQREKSRAFHRVWQKTHIGIYKYYKANAVKRKFVFEISKEDFFSLLDKKCVYCGNSSRGVDRIDSKIGYIKENCVSCCKICNVMKNNMTQNDFIDHCRTIVLTSQDSQLLIDRDLNNNKK